jgi:tetratricopeptide (TPR) repeat protein
MPKYEYVVTGQRNLLGSARMSSMADEWFRSPDWDPDAQADFEERLRRARPYNRAQYLRIKGLALAAAGEVAGARSLWTRVLESTEDSLQQAGALEHLGDSHVDDDPALAEDYFRRLLALGGRTSGTTGTQHIKLAELLLDRGTRDDLAEAADLLVRWVPEAQLPFPSAHFRWNLAAIRLAEAYGDREAAREAAQRALAFAERGPVFPRHPTVGLVEADRKTLKRLRKLAK